MLFNKFEVRFNALEALIIHSTSSIIFKGPGVIEYCVLEIRGTLISPRGYIYSTFVLPFCGNGMGRDFIQRKG